MRSRTSQQTRQAQVLVEFALIALVLYLLLAGILEFGRALFSAQVLQQAVDSAAREISRTPFPPVATLTGPDGVLAGHAAGRQIYDPQYLVVDLDALNGQSLTDYFADKPLLNRLLLPLFIFERREGRNLGRYPGQLLPDATGTSPSGFGGVVIPLVSYSNGGDTVIRLIPVVEEISPDPNADPFSPTPEASPFNLLGANVPPAQRGTVALRINYPFQAATLTSYQEVNGQQVPTATNESGDLGPHAGEAGLGRLAALGRIVRPYRRVLSAQAIFRREIYE